MTDPFNTDISDLGTVAKAFAQGEVSRSDLEMVEASYNATAEDGESADTSSVSTDTGWSGGTGSTGAPGFALGSSVSVGSLDVSPALLVGVAVVGYLLLGGGS